MFRKSFLILFACLMTCVVFAGEKVDYKKFMEKYVEAYNNMDSNKLAALASENFLYKLKWEFHEFRKLRQKPQLTLTNIVVKDKNINCNATLIVGDKTKFKDQHLIFSLKDGKIQSCIEKTFTQPQTIYARDFWTAAKYADAFALVKIERFKSANYEKLIPLPKGYANEQVELSKWIQLYAPKSGQYLIPVRKDKSIYRVVGSSYQLLAYNPEDIENLKQWKEFKEFDKDKEIDFLKKVIADNSFPSLTESSLTRLSAINYFKTKISKEDLDFWKKFVFNPEQSRPVISMAVYFLSQNNFKMIRPLLLDALRNKNISGIAAQCFLRYERPQFIKLMQEWLKDDKTREIALKNSYLMIKDKEFINEAMEYFKNTGIDEIELYLPVLLAKNNEKGNAFIREILNSSDKKYKKLVPQIYTVIIRTGNPAWTNEIIKLAESNEEKGFSSYIKPMALAYLCLHKSPKGFELTEEYFESIKDDKSKHQRCLMAFLQIFKRPFRSFEQLKEFIKIVKSGKAAGNSHVTKYRKIMKNNIHGE